MASLLNLQSVGAAQRASLWARSARGFFPGISVRRLGGTPEVGRISRMSLGCGRIWSVLSPPLIVTYDPASGNDDRHLFSLMIQLTGTTAARQQRRSCVLGPGDCCAIDNGAPFELEVPAASSYLVFLQMPRLSVLGRHPYLERHTAERFDPQEPGTGLLRGLLMNLLDSVSKLEDFQRSAALAGIIELLGVSKPLHSEHVEEMSWRVHAALKCIGARYADPALTAEEVAKAQGISRRRLDKLMVQAAGTTLTAQIWKRRLSQVADDLVEARLASRSVAQIGFSAGFADPAHLSRTFRRSFACTPGEWRQRKGDAADKARIPGA
jgi:AraC family transcriptional activator of tynA and feaB